MFAYLLELDPLVDEVVLVRARLDEAWLAVHTRSLDDALVALQRIEGFTLECSLRDNGIAVDVIYHSARDLALLDDEPPGPLLPPRRRFRVFRHRERAGDGDPPADPPGGTRRNPRLGEEPAISEAGAGPVPEQAMLLIAEPLGSFRQLSQFEAGVRALPGVEHTTMHGFHRGRLQLAVEYTGDVPFVERLRDLEAWRWELVAHGEQIVIRLVGRSARL